MTNTPSSKQHSHNIAQTNISSKWVKSRRWVLWCCSLLGGGRELERDNAHRPQAIIAFAIVYSNLSPRHLLVNCSLEQSLARTIPRPAIGQHKSVQYQSSSEPVQCFGAPLRSRLGGLERVFHPELLFCDLVTFDKGLRLSSFFQVRKTASGVKLWSRVFATVIEIWPILEGGGSGRTVTRVIRRWSGQITLAKPIPPTAFKLNSAIAENF